MTLKVNFNYFIPKEIPFWLAKDGYLNFEYMFKNYMIYDYDKNPENKKLLTEIQGNFRIITQSGDYSEFSDRTFDLGHIGINDNIKKRNFIRFLSACIKQDKIILPFKFTYDDNDTELDNVVELASNLMFLKYASALKGEFWKPQLLNMRFWWRQFKKDFNSLFKWKEVITASIWGTVFVLSIIGAIFLPQSKYTSTLSDIKIPGGKIKHIISHALPVMTKILSCLPFIYAGIKFRTSISMSFSNISGFILDTLGISKHILKFLESLNIDWIKDNKFFTKTLGMDIFVKFKSKLQQILDEEKNSILDSTNKPEKEESELRILSNEFPEAREAYAAMKQDIKEKTSNHLEKFLEELGKKYIEKSL